VSYVIFRLSSFSNRYEVVWAIGVSCLRFLMRPSNSAGICGPPDWWESRQTPRPFPRIILRQILARIPVLSPLCGSWELCLFCLLLGVGFFQRGMFNLARHVKLILTILNRRFPVKINPMSRPKATFYMPMSCQSPRARDHSVNSSFLRLLRRFQTMWLLGSVFLDKHFIFFSDSNSVYKDS
jgi:hypothetical protein